MCTENHSCQMLGECVKERLCREKLFLARILYVLVLVTLARELLVYGLLVTGTSYRCDYIGCE